MIDYSKGKIYVLRSHLTEDIYIGSTCQSLCSRLSRHKANKRAWESGKRTYVTSYHMLDYEDCYIELLEDFPCETKEQLMKREGEIIRQYSNCCNKRKEGRTTEDKKQYNKDYFTKYYLTNREKIIKNHKEQRVGLAGEV